MSNANAIETAIYHIEQARKINRDRLDGVDNQLVLALEYLRECQTATLDED